MNGKGVIMNQEKIGKFIKSIRQQEHLSQQQFASKYGVTYQAVSKWETGKNIPDLAILKQMCQEYGMNLDDFLDTKSCPKRKKIFPWVPSFLLFILLCVFLFLHFQDRSFEFKTLEANCKNFNIYGSVAYNDVKSTIYIPSITYCGETDHYLYKKIHCALYENSDTIRLEIGKYDYSGNDPITLENFLKEVNFQVDHSMKNCNVYQDGSLHLEIEAIKLDGTLITYKIPLKLGNSCKK